MLTYRSLFFSQAKLNGRNHLTNQYPKHQVLRPKKTKNDKKNVHTFNKGIINIIRIKCYTT